MRKNISVPYFLRHVKLSKSDVNHLNDVMSGWGKIFHEMGQLKTKPIAAQKTELEKMLVFEINSEQRLIILTRLLGRYKMVVNTELQEQMFG